MGVSDSRLEAPLSPAYRRGRRVSITIDGKPLDAFDNESVAAAILASGRRILARSIKNHRPRAIFCLQGKCGWCLMTIEGTPNVRACLVSASEGLRVQSQNSFPNVQTDLLGILDRFSARTSAGFQYKTFLHPAFMRKTYLNIMRKFTGLGKVPKAVGSPPRRSYSEKKCDVLVVGGGISGLTAAAEASKLGAKTVLVDENPWLGGTLGRRVEELSDLKEYDTMPAHRVADRLASRIRDNGVEVYTETSAVGSYDGHSVGSVTKDGLVQFNYGSLVIATGAYDRPLVFENNDLPGIYSGSAVEIFLAKYGIRPGTRTVIIGDNHLSRRVLKLCQTAEIEIAAVVTSKNKISPELRTQIENYSAQIFTGWAIQKAHGSKGVEGIQLLRIDGSGSHRSSGNDSERIACDFVSVCYLQPTYELQFQAGCSMKYDPRNGGFLAELDEMSQSSVPGVFVAGDAAGVKPDGLNFLQGKLAGMSAASRVKNLRAEEQRELAACSGALKNMPSGIVDSYPHSATGRCFVCPCEDVVETEIVDSIRQGYDEVEHLKRYTGVGTGICQGKYCVTHLVEILANERNKSPNDIQVPTQRPPVKSLPLESYVVEGFEGRS